MVGVERFGQNHTTPRMNPTGALQMDGHTHPFTGSFNYGRGIRGHRRDSNYLYQEGGGEERERENKISSTLHDSSSYIIPDQLEECPWWIIRERC